MKSLFSFQMLKLRKIRGKQDWWFDVTIKIVVNYSIIFLFEKTSILSSSSSIFHNDFLSIFICLRKMCKYIVHCTFISYRQNLSLSLIIAQL